MAVKESARERMPVMSARVARRVVALIMLGLFGCMSIADGPRQSLQQLSREMLAIEISDAGPSIIGSLAPPPLTLV